MNPTWQSYVERLEDEKKLLIDALHDVVRSTGGALIVQDYGRLNRALTLDEQPN